MQTITVDDIVWVTLDAGLTESAVKISETLLVSVIDIRKYSRFRLYGLRIYGLFGHLVNF